MARASLLLVLLVGGLLASCGGDGGDAGAGGAGAGGAGGGGASVEVCSNGEDDDGDGLVDCDDPDCQNSWSCACDDDGNCRPRECIDNGICAPLICAGGLCEPCTGDGQCPNVGDRCIDGECVASGG